MVASRVGALNGRVSAAPMLGAVPPPLTRFRGGRSAAVALVDSGIESLMRRRVAMKLWNLANHLSKYSTIKLSGAHQSTPLAR